MANVTPIENTDALLEETASPPEIIRHMNGGVRLDGVQNPSGPVDGARAGNLAAQVRKVIFPDIPNTEVEVLHGLGRDAFGFIPVDQDRAASIYGYRRASWDKQRIYLRCNTAATEAWVMVF